MAEKSVLGKGLGALINDIDGLQAVANNNVSNEIEISKIKANPYQPRTKFDEQALNELAQSIKKLGIVQPLTVRKINHNAYQLIAGERRFRAAKIAGLTHVPVYIRIADDDKMLELALVENIQREDLDSIEVAISYQRLIDEIQLTQKDLSDRVGKKRSTISNYLRLLKLPADIQKGIRDKKILMGHARALVNVTNPESQLDIFHKIIQHDYSVRKVEEMVRDANQGKQKKSLSENLPNREYQSLKNHLSSHFETNVDLKRSGNGKGKIIIPFTSDDDLERILAIMDRINS